MRARLPVLLVTSLIFLLLYLWTWTESADVTLRVDSGTCSAGLYGRSSTLPCPGLTGGTLFAFAGESRDPLPRGHGPLDRLSPGSSWAALTITAADGAPIAGTEPLPESFTVRGRLLRPNEPAGLVLLPPGESRGWAFVPDGQTRRGVWWAWEDGDLGRPIQGIPFDKPLLAQTQTLVRLLLDGWQGALLVLLLAGALQLLIPKLAIRNLFRQQALSSRTITALAALFAFGVALHVSLNVLQRIPHVQDSVTYLFQAQTMARGRLTAPAPPLAENVETPHFRQEFLLVRDGHWFGKYPPGYPAVLAIGVLAGAHWLVNPLLAALTIPLVGALARCLYRREREGNPGALSAVPWPVLLLALSPFFLVMSGSLMAHAAELFWTVLFMLSWVKALEENRAQWAFATGLAFGALFLTRQFTAATIGLAFGAVWLAVVLYRAASSQRVNAAQRGLKGRLPRTLAITVLATAPLVVAYFAYQAAVAGHPLSDPRLLYWPYDRVGFGPGFGESENLFTFQPTSAGLAQVWLDDPAQPPRGNTPSLGLYNLGRNYRALQSDLFGWPPLLSLSLIWLAFLLRRPAAADWVLLLVILGVGSGYIAYWAAGIAYGPRYFYAALPALAILSARGISALASATGRRPALIIFFALLITSVVALPGRVESYRSYNFVDAGPRQAVEAAVSPPALVFVTASEADWWEYGAFFSGNTPWLDGEVIYARDLGPGENGRLSRAFPDRKPYLWRDGQIHPLSP